MKSRTAFQVFGWKIACSLLLAAMVAPAWGQQSIDAVSSRKSNRTSAGATQIQNSIGSPDTDITAETSLTHSRPFKPMQAPVEQATSSPQVKSATRLPKLADPEQFKVRNANTSGPWIKLQDQDPTNPLPTPQQIQQDSRAGNANMSQGGLLEGSLKKIDLRTGILNESMQLAVMNRDQEFPDPNFTFIASSFIGPRYAAEYQPVTKTWRSPNMSHRPLYFEDENLERYGNGIGVWQPAVSGVRFFSSVFLLPYRTGKNPLRECQYSLGYMRPGDCNPAYRPAREFSGRGAVFQSVVVGGILAGL